MNCTYVVLEEDRHGDTDVEVFMSEQAAIARAEAVAVRNAGSRYEAAMEHPLTRAMIAGGWVRYIPYGDEGDNVRVLRRELQP